MNSLKQVIVIVGWVFMTIPFVLQAQSLDVYIGGGGSLPLNPSSFEEFYKTGYHADIATNIRFVNYRNLNAQLGVQYSTFDSDLTAGSLSTLVLRTNLFYYLADHRVSQFRPYVLGGMNLYSMMVDENLTSKNERGLGYNFGAGINMAYHRNYHFYVQVSYTTLFTEGEHTTYLPLTIGIQL